MTRKKEFIKFKELAPKPKTKVFAVINIQHEHLLGEIKWYPSFRKYCFFPEANTVWESICLEDIKEFIDNLMLDRTDKKLNQKLCDECDGRNHPAGEYCQGCNLREYRK